MTTLCSRKRKSYLLCEHYWKNSPEYRVVNTLFIRHEEMCEIHWELFASGNVFFTLVAFMVVKQFDCAVPCSNFLHSSCAWILLSFLDYSFHQIWKKCQLFIKVFFCLLFSLSSDLKTPATYIFGYVSNKLDALFMYLFFVVFFLSLCLFLDSFYYNIFRFTNSFFCNVKFNINTKMWLFYFQC